MNTKTKKVPMLVYKTYKHRNSFFCNALGRNRTHISRTGILRAIRCTTRAYFKKRRSTKLALRLPIIGYVHFLCKTDFLEGSEVHILVKDNLQVISGFLWKFIRAFSRVFNLQGLYETLNGLNLFGMSFRGLL